jgi:hypothetical protein
VSDLAKYGHTYDDHNKTMRHTATTYAGGWQNYIWYVFRILRPDLSGLPYLCIINNILGFCYKQCHSLRVQQYPGRVQGTLGALIQPNGDHQLARRISWRATFEHFLL